MFHSYVYFIPTNIFSGLKQIVKMKSDENLKLQNKVDSLLVENKVLIDTNLNLVKGFDVLENDFKMKLEKLAIRYINFNKPFSGLISFL